MMKAFLISLLLALGLAACGPGRAGVVIEWTTASEVNTAGFNLYRGEDPAGPFTRVNPDLIPAASDPLTGGRYEYTDTGVQPGRTYYYLLEDVEYSGVTTRHGPIQSTAPGLSPWLSLALAGAAGVALLAAAARLTRAGRGPALRGAAHDPEKQTARP